MRKLYWYFSAYLKKHGWVFGLSVLGALLVFSFSIPFIAQKLELKPTHYIGLVGRYTLESLPDEVSHKISAGLTRVEEDDTISPYLAERWSVEDSGRTYRFILKENIRWQDGKKLTPEDISYNLPDVEKITTPNDVVFKLPDEFVPFPVVVSQPVTRLVDKRHLLFLKRPYPIGVGEYQVENYQQKGNSLSSITISGPNEKIVYRFYFTEEEAVLAFKRGEVDILSDLVSTYDIGNWDTTTVESTIDQSRYLGVFFNNASPLFPKNVRQALSYAATKARGESRAISPINPNSWAYLDSAKSYDQDLDRAIERLLDELPFEPLVIELTTTNAFVTEAERLKNDWELFGKQAFEACQEGNEVEDKESCANAEISVEIRVTNFPDTNDFQALLIGQEIPPDPDQYNLWHSEQPTNFTRYKNTRIDALLERGRTTPEKNERRAIYQEFQQFLLEDAPVLFLNYLESYEITRT